MFEYRFHIMEFVLRIFLGILFMAQGYDKVFRLKIRGVVDAFHSEMELKHIPPFVLTIAAYFTSYAELIGGLLLIVGFLKYYALSLLGLDILLVSFAFSMLQPMWDMQYVFPRLVILAALFLTPENWELFSIDQLIKH